MKKEEKKAVYSHKSLLTRLFCAVLSVMLIIGIFPMGALADNGAAGKTTIVNPSFEEYLEPSTEISGWTCGEGFEVKKGDAKEGKLALTYSADAEGKATSSEIALAANGEYVFSAWVKAENGGKADLKLIGDAQIAALDTSDAANGEWVSLTKSFTADKAQNAKIELTASGNVKFDDISIRKITREVVNKVKNSGFESAMSNWSLIAGNAQVVGSMSTEGESSLSVPATSGITRLDQAISIDQNKWYMLSADVYRETNNGWTYLDMSDIDGRDSVQHIGNEI